MMASRSRIPFDRNVSKTAAAYNSGNILNMSQSGVKRAKYHHEHTNSHTALQKLVQNNTHRRQISYQGALNQPIQQITGPMITSGGATTLENIEPDDDSNNSQQQNMDHASTDQDKTQNIMLNQLQISLPAKQPIESMQVGRVKHKTQ